MLIYNIGRLWGADAEGTMRLRRGAEMDCVESPEHAWLEFDPHTGLITGMGTCKAMPAPEEGDMDARGGWVFPSFCDSHTHVIYAGSREGEFRDKIDGLSYEEIARRGGGILNSADRLHEASEDELLAGAMERVEAMMRAGTGAIEIKSGYGLRTADELKMLRVAARIREMVPATVRTTFLGAHAVGREYAGRQGEYVDMVIGEMLPAVAAEGLADYVDVFCDRGFFTAEETTRILEAAARYGLRGKIHGDELAQSGGTEAAVAAGALSVDHLENAGEAQLRLLAESDTCATMLPGASFFSGLPYGPARRAADMGCILALASDYNPGSSPSGDMRMVMSLGCIKMKLSPERALNATTINGAYAMGVSDRVGALGPGREANFFMTHALPDLAYLPYAYTEPLIKGCWLRGRKV
ncbi:MAG: imidazolonepropionase [Muribaculaceae bacterium]|nr:imidazolonepropionase [Muribaculaceae bacterium]